MASARGISQEMISGSVIWVTGLSGSGKTTLCEAVWRSLKPVLPQLVLLDGDTIRSAFGGALGYREEDRMVQVQRVQGLAKMLSEQGLLVLVAVLYSNPDLLTWNRQNLNNYFEIYLEASLSTLLGRDNNDLYGKAKRGEITNVVGVDIPWQAPTSPDLVINTSFPSSPDSLAQQVISTIPSLSLTFKRA